MLIFRLLNLELMLIYQTIFFDKNYHNSIKLPFDPKVAEKFLNGIDQRMYKQIDVRDIDLLKLL